MMKNLDYSNFTKPALTSKNKLLQSQAMLRSKIREVHFKAILEFAGHDKLILISTSLLLFYICISSLLLLA